MQFAWALRDSPAESEDVLTADEMNRRVDSCGWSDEKLADATRAWEAFTPAERRELNSRRGGKALMEQLAKIGQRLGGRR